MEYDTIQSECLSATWHFHSHKMHMLQNTNSSRDQRNAVDSLQATNTASSVADQDLEFFSQQSDRILIKYTPKAIPSFIHSSHSLPLKQPLSPSLVLHPLVPLIFRTIKLRRVGRCQRVQTRRSFQSYSQQAVALSLLVQSKQMFFARGLRFGFCGPAAAEVFARAEKEEGGHFWGMC